MTHNSPNLLVRSRALSPVCGIGVLALVLSSALTATAQPARLTGAPQTSATSAAGASGSRWAFIICGHPGDEEHRKEFADSVGRIRTALVDRFGYPGGHVWIRFGVSDKDEKTMESSRGPATKETLAGDAAELQKTLHAEDELWVFVIGHAYQANRAVQLNLPGPDVAPAEFAQWFAGVACRRSVFFMTTPLSGYFTKPLARKGRVVISATEPDFEVNETLFASSLARLLEKFPEGDEQDVDKDGIYSLLDLYLVTALDVAKRYSADNLLATEHALLDDNGDGRGSELQLQYVAEEDAPRAPLARKAQIRADKDGALARSIDLGSLVRKQSDGRAKQ